MNVIETRNKKRRSNTEAAADILTIRRNRRRMPRTREKTLWVWM